MEWKFDRLSAKREARAALAGAHPHVMLVTLVCDLLTLVPPGAAVVAAVLSLATEGGLTATGWAVLTVLLVVLGFYTTVAQVGYLSYVMRLARGENAGFWCLLEGFAQTGRVLAVTVVQFFRILPWALLASLILTAGTLARQYLGLAGLILMILCQIFYVLFLLWLYLRYQLVWFLALDYPEQRANWVISRSIEAMKGRKWACLKLELSFLGWQLLSCLTLGILGLWVNPYLGVTMTRFYEAAAHPGQEHHMPLTF